MKKENISKYIIFIGISTLIAIFIILVQTSYNNMMGPIKKAQNSDLTKPINPDLDIDTIIQIESYIDPGSDEAGN